MEMLLSDQNDGADDLAKRAYTIYRGMKEGGKPLPHWDDLPREDRGLFQWVIRFAWLNGPEGK